MIFLKIWALLICALTFLGAVVCAFIWIGQMYLSEIGFMISTVLFVTFIPAVVGAIMSRES